MTEYSKPAHIAIIMDGNGRWAVQRGKPRPAGHHAGFQTTRSIVEACARRGIKALTLFAFSSENWKRPQQEVSLLMDLFINALSSEIDMLCKNNIRIRFIGERSAFSMKLQSAMQDAEAITAGNDGLQLVVAVNYGGHWDIVNAARQIAEEVKAGVIEPDAIDTTYFASKISLADLPAPDLLIRTGGEQRISNYLLWQLAYSELLFSDVAWPDFSDADLDAAIEQFCGRQRRFGKTGEQVDVDRA